MKKLFIKERLADPDVLKVNDDLFFLSGTGAKTEFPIYESKDLDHFTLKRTYAPSRLDPQHDYCTLWAPDLSLHNGVYYFYFSATRVGKNQACPSGEQPTTFFATAENSDLNFGPPQAIRPNESGPRTVFTPNCPSDGCRNAIRIDSAVVDADNTRWLFYVWFQNGNNISSFRMNDPTRIINNMGPVVFPTAPVEEGINEGPDVFRRGPYYYLFFSAGFFSRQYAMHYIMADSIEGLTRAYGDHRHSQPLHNSKGKLVESHGHNSIVERRGEYYNFFHQGVFNADGGMIRRDTYRQRMIFKSDGTLVAQNYVDVNWSSLPNQEYSLDIVTRSGEVLGPCINSLIIGRRTSTRYTGICPSLNDRVISKSDIAAFRVYWSSNGIWGANWRQIPYDGYSDDIFLDLSGNSLRLNWSWLPKREYSLDIVTRSGDVIGPCFNSALLGRSTSVTYNGICPSAGNRQILKRDIAAFRVYWSDNGVWGAHAKEFPFDGKAQQLFLAL